MMNLKQLLNKPLNKISGKVVILLLVIALLGFIDAGYLTVKHFQNVIPPCSLVDGCEEVLTSTFSAILGIPVSLLGAIFYFLILVGVFGYFESKNDNFLKLVIALSIPGFIFSLWFFFVQAFILQSYCMYCLGSFVTSTLIFVVSVRIVYLNRN